MSTRLPAPEDTHEDRPAPATGHEDRPAPASASEDQPGTGRGPAHPISPVMALVGVAALVIIGAGIRSQASMLGPMFLALTLVITAYPMVTWMRRHKVPGPLATLASLVAIYAVLAAIAWSMVWSVLRLVEVMPQYMEQGTRLYDQAIAQMARFGVEESQLEEMLSTIEPGQVAGVVGGLAGQLSGGASLLTLLIIGLIFLVLDTGSMEARMRVLADERPGAAAAFGDFARRVRSYWLVTTVFGILVAVVDVVFLWALGIPLAITWGVFSFVTNYIPNVGFVIGLIPPTLIALLEKGPVMAVIVAVGYWVINFVFQTIIQPRVTGDMVGLNATVIFVSLIVWAYLLGPLGALVAVPATIFVKALLVDHIPANRWMAALLGETPKQAVTTPREDSGRAPEQGAEASPAGSPQTP
ncbi:AI-2E family transporter [Kytococcus sedentarius]|uniref:AI-2E family transporter n=1 Tax=Kytococcus sedentarius TaxID=1276 RepID=UPI0035BC1096